MCLLTLYVVNQQTLDCDIYERIQEYLTTASSTAADIARVEANTFSAIGEEAEKVCSQSLLCPLKLISSSVLLPPQGANG